MLEKWETNKEHRKCDDIPCFIISCSNPRVALIKQTMAMPSYLQWNSVYKLFSDLITSLGYRTL